MSRIKNPLFSKSEFVVLNVLFTKPSQIYHLRGLSVLTGLSTTSVSRVVSHLQKEQVITVEKTRITTNIRVDLNSMNYKFYKKLYNLYLLHKFEIVEKIVLSFRPKAVVLFGSYSKGEDMEGSDIDLLVLSSRRESIDLTRFERKLHRKINLVIVDSLDKSSSEFKNGVANGMVLYGYVKVI